jgi:F0F1-type ATP synthase assembly protein I
MAKQPEQNWGHFLGLGLNVAVGVGLGALIGWWLDKRYGWSPKGMTIGALVGLAGGMYLLLKEAMKANKD